MTLVEVLDNGEWLGPFPVLEQGRTHVLVMFEGRPAAWATTDTRPCPTS